ncbi:MAG: cytochrome c [Gammaproteobacteria bacterium]|nr:cytochrome c [Gammaproteobacteria bacterium]
MSTRLVLLLMPLILLGCAKPPPPSASGAELFDYYCTKCHGEGALGKTFFGYPSLLDKDLPPELIAHVIKRGSAERGNKHQHRDEMPAFAMLSDKQVKRLTDYLIKLRQERLSKASTAP